MAWTAEIISSKWTPGEPGRVDIEVKYFDDISEFTVTKVFSYSDEGKIKKSTIQAEIIASGEVFRENFDESLKLRNMVNKIIPIP